MFEQLDLDDELCRAVAELGYIEPTSIQQLVIPAAMEGKDIPLRAQAKLQHFCCQFANLYWITLAEGSARPEF